MVLNLGSIDTLPPVKRSLDIIQEIWEFGWKTIVSSLSLPSSCNLALCTDHTSSGIMHDFVTNEITCIFTSQLLQISPNIIFVHFLFKIRAVIRSDDRFCCLTHSWRTYITVSHIFNIDSSISVQWYPLESYEFYCVYFQHNYEKRSMGSLDC